MDLLTATVALVIWFSLLVVGVFVVRAVVDVKTASYTVAMRRAQLDAKGKLILARRMKDVRKGKKLDEGGAVEQFFNGIIDQAEAAGIDFEKAIDMDKGELLKVRALIDKRVGGTSNGAGPGSGDLA